MSSSPRFLIVKMSSLGDVLLSLNTAQYLKQRDPTCHITWVIEERMKELASSSPYIDEVIAFDTRVVKKGWRCARKLCREMIAMLRTRKYDVVFDLQGNCKSGLITLLSRSSHKIGWGRHSVAEWPNLLVTRRKIEANKDLVRAEQYLAFIKEYFQDRSSLQLDQHLFKPSSVEEVVLHHPLKIMVCPGSRWPNKQLSIKTWELYLRSIEQRYHPLWVFVWGSSSEKRLADELSALCKEAKVIGGLSFPSWQQWMRQMHVVISVDSCALHLAGLSHVPTFGIHGPSSSALYSPCSSRHRAYQGICPYKQTFTTRCSKLRTCLTGACIKDIAAETLIKEFTAFLHTL